MLRILGLKRKQIKLFGAFQREKLAFILIPEESFQFSRVFGPILVILRTTASYILLIVNPKKEGYGCNERNTQQWAIGALIILEQKHGIAIVFGNRFHTVDHVGGAFDVWQ